MGDVPDYDESDEQQMSEAGGYDDVLMHEADDLMEDTDIFNSNEMEFDEDKKFEGAKQVYQPVLVNRAIIDLEQITQNYKSHALTIRLNYIAETCPPLRADVLRALIDYLRNNSQNTSMYTLVYQKIEFYRMNGGLKDDEMFPPLDQAWVEQTSQRANARLDALNAEFRRQKDDGVKESIRRAINDVFNQLLTVGNIEEALKLYSRGIREYCTNPGVLIEMLLNWISATVYAEQWNKLSILIPQVERAISEVLERDAPASSSRNASYSAPSFTSGAKSSRSAKELVSTSGAKVSAVSGLDYMKRNEFKRAAQHFISIDIESFEYAELLSAGDVALYGTMCALATFDRTELKTNVLGSSQFRKFLESEPKLVELLQKFCRNQFGATLDILNDLRDQLLLNVYLAPYVAEIYALIRKRAIVQFFQPYMSTNMDFMAAEFRTTVDELEEELVDLIRCGALSARIDSHAKIIEAKVPNRRSDVYNRSLKVNKSIDSLARSLLIRASLQEMKCIVGLDGNSRKESTCKNIF